MQLSAGQDLPHTRTRALHWLATAAALAAAVATASFVQPPDATATTDAASGARAAAVGPAPDPHAARYPVDCGPNRLDVVDSATGDLDGDGSPETVAVVRCHTETGTPPSGVYVLARPATGKGAPRVAATLLAPARQRSVEGFAVRGGAVTATLLGYSTTDVPRCCPDVRARTKWQWKGGKFVQSELPASSDTAGV
ncbi:hypothetical protein AB0B21_37000 [Streptomyces rimosus]|uniref:hypothetical protein n=1 Tax=Streptomyces rimosus TaxID=1927 RepID=UPI0005187728|nr:hypothetical protein [Streptomyces rimosus]